MTNNNRAYLIDVYKRYGFSLAREYPRENALVFTLKTGYFDNADIVPLDKDANLEKPFNDFTRLGFACTKRDVVTPQEAENQLFRGFFSVESIRQRLLDDYSRFTTSIVKLYSKCASYKYINAPYKINGREGTKSVPEEILERIAHHKPIMFLIEAAAGFGKTCTAYELIKQLIETDKFLPLYSELSKNRQARIFRHIFLDEIDRTFPLLGSRLVQTEIKNGRVITILDGFDELLRKNEETGDIENREPMLETISEFLSDHAKIILTTRRTVLFDGDEFHTWLESHANDFELIRIKISEPKISDWLSAERLSALESVNIDVQNIANPVLLSYLTFISSEEFDEVLAEPEGIVESYFNYMLDRERDRQDLRMDVAQQSEILQSIAHDMVELGYTAEDREYIVDYIRTTHSKLLGEIQRQYSIADKPSKDELANKLASHALLDRSSNEPNKIGFINEFVLGSYVSSDIMRSCDWLSDDLRFIEPAVLAYIPRSAESKADLFTSLKPSMDYLDTTSRISISAKLIQSVPFDMNDGEAESIKISSIEIGSRLFRNFQFNDCQFENCIFRLENLIDVNFLNCRFFGCKVICSDSTGTVHVLGCDSDLPNFIDELYTAKLSQVPTIVADREIELEKYVLSRFWPAGDDLLARPTRLIYKPAKNLYYKTDKFSPSELYVTVSNLRKIGLLEEMPRSHLLTINMNCISDIFRILEGK